MERVRVSGANTIKYSHNSEDIIWSSSDSDCDISLYAKHQTPTTKKSQIHKNKNTKKRSRSLKNLGVTVVPIVAPYREANNTSPVLGLQINDRPSSPVLTPFNSVKAKRKPSQTCNSSLEAEIIQETDENEPLSPVLSCKSLRKNAKRHRNVHSLSKDPKKLHMDSGITSPNLKRAFRSKKPVSPSLELLNWSAGRYKESRMTGTASKVHDVRHVDKHHNTSIDGSAKITPTVYSEHCNIVKSPISSTESCNKKFMNDIEMISKTTTAEVEAEKQFHSNDQLSPILSTKRSHPDFRSPPPEVMVKKIKSYFDSHFSSQSISQASIHDSISQSQIPDSQPQTITSQVRVEDCGEKITDTQIKIDESHSSAPTQDSSSKIISVSSEKTSPSGPSISDVSSTSKVSIVIKTESEEVLQTKRKRFKKDGLRSRLHLLLKKQQNQISLWQHEMYLASNSNFVVPSSSSFKLFAIEKITHKYGSYLIEAVDLANKLDYLVLLSLHFECNIVVTEKSLLKLYEPYEVIERDSKRYVIRACKFQCLNIKEEKS